MPKLSQNVIAAGGFYRFHEKLVDFKPLEKDHLTLMGNQFCSLRVFLRNLLLCLCSEFESDGAVSSVSSFNSWTKV